MKKLFLVGLLFSGSLYCMEGALRSAIYSSAVRRVLGLVRSGMVVMPALQSYADRILHRGIAIELDEYSDGLDCDVSNSNPGISERVINLIIHHPAGVNNFEDLRDQRYGVGNEYAAGDTEISFLESLQDQ